MSIRAKLALSFLAFTVLPLAGFTLYSYHSSIQAFRNVVEEESAMLAGEMSHRMEAATRDIQQRMDRLDRKPFYHLMAASKEQPQVRPAELYGDILAKMGDMAPYVDSLEFPANTATKVVRPAPPAVPPVTAPRGSEAGPPNDPDLSAVVVRMDKLKLPPGPPDLSSLSAWVERQKGKLVLTCEAADKAGQKISQTAMEKALKGQIDQKELEAAIAQAQAAKKAALEMQRRMQTSPTPPTLDPAGQRRRGGDRESKLELVIKSGAGGWQGAPSPIKAQIRAHELVRRVFAEGRHSHGEIQFAVDQSGGLHAADEAQMTELSGLGLESSKSIDQAIKACPDDWIVATVKEPMSGMTFGVARPVGDSLREMRRTALRNLGVGAGFIALALLGVIPLSGRMTRRLSTLSQGVEKLSKGDLSTRVPVNSKDELGRLAGAFNQMAADLAEHQKRLVVQERLQKELEMCRRIQEVLLPQAPLRAGFAEAKGVSIPARQVGGDFFNYFILPEGDVAVLMGDVSGKGVPAALLMANLQARLQAKLQVERDLAKLAAELDLEVSQQTEPQTFATLFMGIINRDGRSMRWVNAGHNPQFVLTAAGELRSLESTGKPVGLLPGDGYEERQMTLGRGDFLFLYTDGLIEAENPSEEEFGAARLEQILLEQKEATLDEIVAAIVAKVREYRAGAEAGDDATLLALKIA